MRSDVGKVQSVTEEVLVILWTFAFPANVIATQSTSVYFDWYQRPTV